MAAVTRPLRWRTLVMSYVARCDTPFPEYDGSVVRFGVWPQGWKYLVEGWSSRPGRVGVSSVSDTGTLAFRLPDGLRDRDLSVMVRVQSEGSLSIEVNGRPADVASSPQAPARVLLARVPAGAVSPDPTKALVIKVRTDEGRLTLESLEVAAD